jgi:hypothetical protein
MDFKSAFWQIELHPDSRYLTVFHANDKLYRYKRLTMGVKPAQGELNVALQPLFANIPQAHLIHDDLIVAAKNDVEHNKAIEEVMKAIFSAGITLNPNKCTFGASEIEFWGLRIGSTGVRPSPVKVDALNYITAQIEGRFSKFPVYDAVECRIHSKFRKASSETKRVVQEKYTVCVDWRASSCIRSVDRRIQEEHAAPIF